MKTILLHVQDNASLIPRVEAALSIARSFSAHLTCLHVTPIEAYAAIGAFDGAILMADISGALEQGEIRVREALEKQLRTEDVSWDYRQVTGHVASTIIQHAALADLLITGRESPYGDAYSASQVGLIGDLLHRCRTPLFIPPADGSAIAPTGPAVIAWDGSFEAANAVRASVAFLRSAAQVIVLQVEQREEQAAFPDTRLLEYLSRHDVHAELRTVASRYENIAQLIIGEASRVGAGTIVLGGYNHSRTGELLFGGITRTLLLGCPLAMLMAH